jgi:hypothetical protein
MLGWEPDEEDLAFTRIYGSWEVLSPAQVQQLMAGFPAPWWIVGGHAIEAFTGVQRGHEDLDLVIFSHDFPHLRAQLGDRFHLWSNTGGTFRFIDDRHPEPQDPLSQIWVREHALAPWIIDCPLNPSVDGRWQSKRDPELVADLDEVTWVADDGIRYLNPEIVLHYKATQRRAKDEIDLANTWPRLGGAQRRWLRDAVARLDPGHPWTDRLADA